MEKQVNELYPIVCSKCGKVITTAIASVKAFCPKCKVWSTNKKDKEVC